jgi:excisionase family DNA binding protein
MSPAEIANRLRISRRTVYRLVARGALTATRVGGQWRIDGDSLDRYVASQTRTATV